MNSTQIQKLDRVKATLEGLLTAQEHLEKAEERARTISNEVPQAASFVGVCGARLAVKEFELLDGALTLRQVRNAPGLVHVVSTAKETSSDYLHVARHSPAISIEIAAGHVALDAQLNDGAMSAAWHAAALLKLCDQDFLACPASATVSWDCIAAAPNQSVVYRALDETPRCILGRPSQSEIGLSELEWVRDVFMDGMKLRNHSTSRRFGLAFNVAYTWNHSHNPRVALSNIWCGMEALFGDARDYGKFSKQMAGRVEAWLPGTSATDVLDLYRKRCDAVHGRWLDDSELLHPIAKSIALLVKAIRACIDRKKQTLPDWQ